MSPILYFHLHINKHNTLNTLEQEAEHTLWVVPARTKDGAVSKLQRKKPFDKLMVNRTPIQQMTLLRYQMSKDAKLLDEMNAEEAASASRQTGA